MSSDDSMISVSKTDIQEIVKTAVTEALAERDTQMLALKANMDIVTGELDAIKETCCGLRQALEEVQESLKKVLESKGKEVEEMKKTMGKQEEEKVDLQRKVNDLENYQRRENLRITGLPERNGEDPIEVVKKFFKENAFSVPGEKIHVAHRIGPKSRDKPRPLLIRFADRKTKDDVVRARRTLKGSGKTISEDVSRLTIQTLMRVQRSDGIQRSWIWNAKVYAVHHDDSKPFTVLPFQSIQDARSQGKR